jgi:hypothetical protein
VLAYFASNPNFSWDSQGSARYISQCLLALESRKNVSHLGESSKSVEAC